MNTWLPKAVFLSRFFKGEVDFYMGEVLLLLHLLLPRFALRLWQSTWRPPRPEGGLGGSRLCPRDSREGK